MPAAPLQLAALTAVTVAVLVFAEKARADWLVRISKPAASFGFIATAVAAGALETSFGNWVLVALVLSMVGDVLLLPRDSPKAFLYGLGSFLAGHLAYCASFVVIGLQVGWALGALLLLGPVAWTIAKWLMPHVRKKPKMVRPVVAYIVVITAMVALSVGAVADRAPPILCVAALLFFASDLAVARERFVKHEFLNRGLGLPTYYAAQVLFAGAAGMG